MRKLMGGLLALAASAALTSGAFAADPGRWTFTGGSTLPLYYYQGVTHDPAGNFYFDGIDFGLYRTDSQLNETARNDDVIPPDVHLREHYNHIGDITWDRQEGGRVLLPLECYYPPAGNTCNTGSIGVADPTTLRWRYYVKLDPAYIPKAMWAEVSPNGQLIWTSSGNDLLAYRTADVVPANAATGADSPPIHPVQRLPGVVPPSGITGAVFVGGRLFLAGDIDGQLQVRSVDLSAAPPPCGEFESPASDRGESEGLDLLDMRGGTLPWLWSSAAAEPTYGNGHTELLTFL